MYASNHLASKFSAILTQDKDRVFAWLPDGTKISYATLFENAEKLATVLTNNGVRAGDRVAVQVGKSICAVELYLGTLLAGGVFLPLNTDYTPAEIDYFLSDATPTVFICPPNSHNALQHTAEKTGVKSLLTLSDDGKSSSLADQKNAITSNVKVTPRPAEDLAAILYTSGTTGRSKGAMLSHRALASNAATLVDYWKFSSQDRLIHALPIFHIHGLFVAINITLYAGSSLYFLPQFDAGKIVEALPFSTVLMGVPAFYVRLLQHTNLSKESAKNMRLFISGSAPLLRETHKQWKIKTGHAILERYGMTETNMNTSNPYSGERRPGTVGFPLPGVELKITHSETGETLENGNIGQIEIRGPNVFSGYWKMPSKTAEELREDGWFLTGDIGIVDSEGYVSIIGRIKDLIISGGYNVYPKEIETIIDKHSLVKESAIIGVPHPDFGEAVIAVVVPYETGKISDTEIIEFTKISLANYKRPKHVFFIEELPRNTMGKMQKAKLRKIYKSAFDK